MPKPNLQVSDGQSWEHCPLVKTLLSQACLHWVETGRPDTDRQALIDAALGDWGS
jgi:hypothetical protein